MKIWLGMLYYSTVILLVKFIIILITRQLVELGYRGTGEIIRREDFEDRKRIYLEKTNKSASDNQKQLASSDHDLSDSPFLQVLLLSQM